MQEVQKASQTEGDGAAHDDGPYASALAALRAKCPDHVPEERWRQAVEDGQQFLAVWGAQAQAFGWAARELFVPERPAANYSPIVAASIAQRTNLAPARPPGDRVDGDGGGHALPQRCYA